MEKIGRWLDRLGLGQYAPSFTANGIGWDILGDLSERDLRELGLSLGDRKRFLKAVAELNLRADPVQIRIGGVSDVGRRGTEAERRQLTVMFCDLVGSTELSQRMDPEDWRALLMAYQEACAAVIERYDGRIAQYLGDGLTVYFGLPQAHEDDAQRAARAGLEILTSLRTLNQRIRGERGFNLSVRIGIHTGLVVTGEIGAGEAREQLAAVGETPNIAARIQSLADPGSVVVSDSTRRLVEGLFSFQQLGPRLLKGLSRPIKIFRLLAETDTPSRFDAVAARGLTPLVGRAKELDLLLERWEQAKGGKGQAVLVTGEAGIGKSRLVRHFREQLSDEHYGQVSFYCSPFYQSSPFHPVIDQLARDLRLDEHENPAAKVRNLEAALSALKLPLQQLVPVFAALLSLPLEGRYAPLDMEPRELKARTLDALIRPGLAMAEQAPLLIVFEDAHWCDPSSLELLGRFSDQCRNARILLLITRRPELQQHLRMPRTLTKMTLARLSRRETEAMLRNVIGGSLRRELTDQLAAKSDGVPLFIEELSKSVLESGLVTKNKDGCLVLTAPSPQLTIPASLRDALTARLDRLSAAKEVAQAAAVIGRIFDKRLLADVSGFGEKELGGALTQLVASGLLRRRDTSSGCVHEFVHVLVRDAAYALLLRDRRRELHARAAEAILRNDPELPATMPEVVARHFTEAALAHQAIEYWRRAADRAHLRSANAEAVAHLREALGLLCGLSESKSRDEAEIGLQIRLGLALIALVGGHAPEARKAFARARELCLMAGDTGHLYSALYGLWNGHISAGEIKRSAELATESLELARRNGAASAELVSRRMLATSLITLGESSSAEGHLLRVLKDYVPARDDKLAYDFGQHPRIAALVSMAYVRWYLGFPHQALSYSREALREVDATSHFNTKAYALAWTSGAFLLCRLDQLAGETARRLIAFASEYNSRFWSASGSVQMGMALVRGGALDAGLERMDQGMAVFREGGLQQTLPYFLCLEAEACLLAGRLEEASAALEEARSCIERTEQWFYAPEIYRLAGEVLLSVGADLGKAEAAFVTAIKSARRHDARSWELRAVVSLARLRRQQGRSADARRLLVPIINWFAEGCDLPDIAKAAALLDELREPATGSGRQY